MLERLVETWRQREGECSESEAIRRCIVYTFSKLMAGVDSLDENSLLRALSIALGGLAKNKPQ
jgi:hypothetical protein